MSGKISKMERKNWAISQKKDFASKSLQKSLHFGRCCAKIHYCQADVRQNETLQNRRSNVENPEKFDKDFQKIFRKCLTGCHESGRINKLSAERLRRTGP